MTHRPTTLETVTDLPARQCHTMQHMRDSGLLWFINRSLFHPIGYALALDGDDWDSWSLHYAGGDVVTFEGVDEDAKLAAFQQLLATAREHGVSPPGGISYWAADGAPEQLDDSPRALLDDCTTRTGCPARLHLDDCQEKTR